MVYQAATFVLSLHVCIGEMWLRKGDFRVDTVFFLLFIPSPSGHPPTTRARSCTTVFSHIYTYFVILVIRTKRLGYDMSHRQNCRKWHVEIKANCHPKSTERQQQLFTKKWLFSMLVFWRCYSSKTVQHNDMKMLCATILWEDQTERKSNRQNCIALHLYIWDDVP